jgi:DNA mismatch repair ATPase MutS
MPLVSNKDKLEKLIENNFNVVIVDEYPNKNNKIERKISKIITPATNIDSLSLDNSYLMSIYI